MKLMKLFAILALAGISNAAFGYNFTFTNKTDKAVVVTVLDESINRPEMAYAKIRPIPINIQPGQSHTYASNGTYCLHQVTVNGQAVETPSVCRDAAFDITGTLGTQGINFKLSPAQ